MSKIESETKENGGIIDYWLWADKYSVQVPLVSARDMPNVQIWNVLIDSRFFFPLFPPLCHQCTNERLFNTNNVGICSVSKDVLSIIDNASSFYSEWLSSLLIRTAVSPDLKSKWRWLCSIKESQRQSLSHQ